ncbi:MAG: hypothetical protein V4472_24950 [Pseudomonadota bacterium]
MSVVQCQFASGTARTAGYVEADRRLRPGVQVRFKGERRWWTILSLGKPTEAPLIHRPWANNI